MTKDGSMSDSFVGETKMFGGKFAPSGCALCNGQSIRYVICTNGPDLQNPAAPAPAN